MKKIVLFALMVMSLAVGAHAEDRMTRIGLSTGLLYERCWDVTLSAERETQYHNIWEYSANVYLKWEDCPTCQHVCSDSFWNSYNTWSFGVAYKPSVFHTRNITGHMRLGAFVGSDTHDVIGGVTLGYEHDYTLCNGIVMFWQCKSDLVIGGKDLFRTGVSLGVKFPIH